MLLASCFFRSCHVSIFLIFSFFSISRCCAFLICCLFGFLILRSTSSLSSRTFDMYCFLKGLCRFFKIVMKAIEKTRKQQLSESSNQTQDLTQSKISKNKKIGKANKRNIKPSRIPKNTKIKNPHSLKNIKTMKIKKIKKKQQQIKTIKHATNRETKKTQDQQLNQPKHRKIEKSKDPRKTRKQKPR